MRLGVACREFFAGKEAQPPRSAHRQNHFRIRVRLALGPPVRPEPIGAARWVGLQGHEVAAADQAAAQALRRYYANAKEFPADVAELLRYFEPAQPGQTVQAVPGAGVDIEAWILGSSLFGARLAGGCPSGLGLSGVMQLSVSGLVGMACFLPFRKLPHEYLLRQRRRPVADQG